MNRTHEILCQVFDKELDEQFADLLANVFRFPILDCADGNLELSDGTQIPVVKHIPRFVASDLYVGSFSFQWSVYTQTQVDSKQGTNLTENELFTKTGLTRELVAGKLILDAGVGVGRHAEILAQWGAHVIGVDLSASVEAARENLRRYPNAVVLQADLGALPFRGEAFDLIISIGVLHHTPNTRESTCGLVPYIRPGGALSIWVYDHRFKRRGEWIPMASKLPYPMFNEWCRWVIDIARSNRGNHLVESFIRQFPFATFHPTVERSVLNLFDGYSPEYHWIHTSEEVCQWFKEFGLVDIRPNTVEASAFGVRPMAR